MECFSIRWVIYTNSYPQLYFIQSKFCCMSYNSYFSGFYQCDRCIHQMYTSLLVLFCTKSCITSSLLVSACMCTFEHTGAFVTSLLHNCNKKLIGLDNFHKPSHGNLNGAVQIRNLLRYHPRNDGNLQSSNHIYSTLWYIITYIVCTTLVSCFTYRAFFMKICYRSCFAVVAGV